MEQRYPEWQNVKGTQHPAADDSVFDAAWAYLNEHRGALGTADLKQLRWKIDKRLLPFLSLCYLVQFLDKVVYNYAGVMGMRQDLNLKGNDYSNIATFFFLSLLCFEAPNIFFLQKVPAAKWLGLNVTLWGICTACSASVNSYRSLLPCRILVGCFESTTMPSLLIISSRWYDKSEQAFRFIVWFTAVPVGQIIGGLLSFGFQHISEDSDLPGWRIMFLVMGAATIVIGILTILLLPDTPMKASWLSEDEKVTLLKHVSTNKTGVENSKFRFKEIREALVDSQVYLLCLCVTCLTVSGGVISVYSTTIIKNLGFSSRKAALMNIPTGIIGLIYAVCAGFAIRKRPHHRVHWLVGSIIPSVIGASLMSFLPEHHTIGIMAGMYIMGTALVALPIYWSWAATNVAGYTKRAFVAGALAAAVALGNILGPQTFQAHDAPEYRPAKIAVVGTLCGSIVCTLVLCFYYRRMNKKRGLSYENLQVEKLDSQKYLMPETWAGLTDKQNSSFVYMY